MKEDECKTCKYITWMKETAKTRNIDEKEDGFKTYLKANIGMETYRNRIFCGSVFPHMCKLKYCPECGKKV